MTFIYNLGIALALIACLPRIFWKKKFGTFWGRLRSKPPISQGRPVIWINAVSLGEAKSAKGLLSKIKSHYPHAFVLVTTSTAPGLEEAKGSLAAADSIGYMPYDFSWVMRAWVKALQPQLLLLIETDFWIQHMTHVKKSGGKIVLVSGKMSERSARRFAKAPLIAKWFTKRLFSLFDVLIVQNEEYYTRFASLTFSKLYVGGNLKLDALPEPSKQTHRRNTGLSIAIVSTHAPEEEELLSALETVAGTIFLVPRHPERFDLVAKMLEAKQISYGRWTQGYEKQRVILVDAMGQLPTVYALCDLAIVAGSFSSQLGGHNVLEPCLYGLPVLFGPYMHNQKELAARVLQAGAGKQVKAEDLGTEIARFCQNPNAMKEGVLALSQKSGNALDATLQILGPFFQNLRTITR